MYMRFPKEIVCGLGTHVVFPERTDKIKRSLKGILFTLSDVHEEPNDSHKVFFLL